MPIPKATVEANRRSAYLKLLSITRLTVRVTIWSTVKFFSSPSKARICLLSEISLARPTICQIPLHRMRMEEERIGP